MHTETVAICAPKFERTAIRKRPKLKKRPKGELRRRALRADNITSEPIKAKTGYDVIKHLIGSCKGGSDDLATNPKHLQDFGR